MMTIPRTRLVLLLLFGGFCAGPSLPPASAQEVLTNDSVIAMVRAGLAESLIVTKIQSTQSKFDLSTNALVNLKQAGVGEKVIEAMLTAGASPTGSPPASASPFKSRNVIYYFTNGQYIELAGTVGQVETSRGFLSRKSELVIEGHKAKVRITERQPVFFSPAPDARVPLVEHKDRNLHLGEVTPVAGRSGIRKEDTVEVLVERDSRTDARGDWFRITPREPLAPGEYGFATGRQIFDFGVD